MTPLKLVERRYRAAKQRAAEHGLVVPPQHIAVVDRAGMHAAIAWIETALMPAPTTRAPEHQVLRAAFASRDLAAEIAAARAAVPAHPGRAPIRGFRASEEERESHTSDSHSWSAQMARWERAMARVGLLTDIASAIERSDERYTLDDFGAERLDRELLGEDERLPPRGVN
jgi:hypothetical protein